MDEALGGSDGGEAAFSVAEAGVGEGGGAVTAAGRSDRAMSQVVMAGKAFTGDVAVMVSTSTAACFECVVCSSVTASGVVVALLAADATACAACARRLVRVVLAEELFRTETAERREERRTSAADSLVAASSDDGCLLAAGSCASFAFSLPTLLVAGRRGRLAVVDLGGRTELSTVDLRDVGAAGFTLDRCDCTAVDGSSVAALLPDCVRLALASSVARRVERRSVGAASLDCSAAFSINSTSTVDSGANSSTEGEANG